MSASRRNRRRKGGECYAMLPLEVLESKAYAALPDWAARVLVAMASQYRGKNNGSFALPFASADALGVSQQWKLYAGIRLLELTDLVICTRRGRLDRGTKLASMYALTWRGIDEPKDGVVYDRISPCPVPTHAWSKWIEPADWSAVVQEITHRNRGRARPPKNPHTTTSGNGRSTTSGNGKAHIAPPPRGMETPFSAPPPRGTSRSRSGGRGAAKLGAADTQLDSAIGRMVVMHAHLLDRDIARSCHTEVERVARVRARIADGWRPG